jgi:hypothetical protein
MGVLPVYKYMSDEGALRFLKTLRVRFTQPDDQNDPFEFRPMVDFEGTAGYAEEKIDAHLTSEYGTAEDALRRMEVAQAADSDYPKLRVSIPELRKMISDDPALRQMVTECVRQVQAEIIKNSHPKIVDHMKAKWEEFRQVVGQALGIFCLTEDPAHSPMWAHYANKHSGVAVEFDEHHQWFDQRTIPKDDIRHLKQVTYVANPAPRTWKQVTAIDMLYTKGAEWTYEREWRIIRPLKDGTEVVPGIFCFDVPPDAVRSIILGCRTSRALGQEIRAIVAGNPRLSHVRIKRANLAAGGKIEIVDAP